MKKTLIMALLVLAAPAIAKEKANPMEGAFGNTILSVAPDGAETRTSVDPDGTYKSITGGLESRGTWIVSRGKICYSAAGAPPLCALGPNKKPGSKWKVFVNDDNYYAVSIVQGRAQ